MAAQPGEGEDELSRLQGADPARLHQRLGVAVKINKLQTSEASHNAVY